MPAGLGSLGSLGSLRVNLSMPTTDFDKDIKSADKSLGKFETATDKRMKKINVAMVGIGVATVTAVALAVNHFGNFEQSMKNVQAVSGATAEEFETLKEFAIDMGSTTAFTAKEAGDAMYFLASAGLSVAEQMKTTSAVLDLASATQTGLAESSRIVVNTMSGFGLEAENSRRIADVFAESIATSQANMSKLGVAMPVVSATMDDLGISLETTVTGLSLLFDKGGRAETAATGLRNAMKKLIEPTGEAAEEIERLELTVGELDPRTNSLVDIIGKLEKAGFDTAASIKIFGLENDAMNKLVATGAEKFAEFEKSMQNAAGAAQEMKDVQLDSLAGDITLLKSAVDGAVISFGSTFSSTIRGAATTLTDLVTQWNNLGDTTKSIISWTTALGGIGVGLIGGLGLLGTVLPKVGAGLAILTATSWGPIGLGIVAVGLAITGLALALDKYFESKTDAFKELETVKKNAGGITAAIDDITRAIGKLTELQVNGLKQVSLYGVGIRTLGKEVRPIDEQIKRLGGRLEDLQYQLVLNQEGYRGWSQTARVFKDDAEAATKQVGKLNSDIADTPDILQNNADSLDNSAKAYESYLDFITDEFTAWTSSTGKGFKATTLERAKWLEGVLTTVEKDSDAWRALTNKREQLLSAWGKEASFLEKSHTSLVGMELEKRDVVDKDFMDKRTANREVQITKQATIFGKVMTMIKEGFSFETILASERSDKLIAIRAAQYGRESDEFDKFLIEMVRVEKVFLGIRESQELREFAKLERGAANRVRLEDERLQEIASLQGFFLNNANKLLKQSFDIQTAFRTKEGEDRIKFYEDGLSSVKDVFNEFKPFFKKYNLDLVELDKWRADQMLQAEKKLSAAKKKEIKDVQQTYREHVMEAQEFWGTEKGLRVPLSSGIFEDASGSFSANAFNLGLGEAIRIRNEEEIAPVSPTTTPSTTTQAPTPQATRSTPSIGGNTFIFNIDNLFGDEAALNALAEDVARRIQGQNIQLN